MKKMKINPWRRARHQWPLPIQLICIFFFILWMLIAGCASIIQSADNGLVAGPPEYVGIVTGAAVNTVMLVAKRPWWQRLLAVETVAYAKRYTTWFGPKWEGWHLEVNVGAFASEWMSWFHCKGPCNR